MAALSVAGCNCFVPVGEETDGGEGGDAGSFDAGSFDAGPFDAGPFDAGPFDAGPFDAGPFDAGPFDAGPFDAGVPDAGPEDAGQPDAGQLNPIGNYDVDMLCLAGCSGSNPHFMTISTWNPATGTFSGTGYYKPDNNYTWTVTGMITGATFTLTFVYTGSNPGYMLTINGTIDATGAPATGGGATGIQVFSWTATRAP